MAKPLLTDDLIEKERRRRAALEEAIRQDMAKDETLAAKYDAEEARLAKESVYKSRRIENAKTQARGKKLNRWLLISWVVLIALIYYIIKWG
ncbi:MAG: cell wall synthase accessory phosphoprotein MacP [Streptococcaceae bacterium]|jgi:hypothetical protein|nr:cell wall synthase accessory phosphoprotein MacP [Streptococcaceae bacterium]